MGSERVHDGLAVAAAITADPRFVELGDWGSMTWEIYAPRGHDPQQPHDRDEIYVVVGGSATLMIEGAAYAVRAGSAAFVAAGEDHRFVDLSEDFVTWVIFGGERHGVARA
jgi:mannose-6-phosphate isomerase-like protein (cupin superfamily)